MLIRWKVAWAGAAGSSSAPHATAKAIALLLPLIVLQRIRTAPTEGSQDGAADPGSGSGRQYPWAMASKRQIFVGGVPIGGGAPVAVQTMTKTETANLDATMEQIEKVA